MPVDNDPAAMVNLDRYPIADLNDAAGRAFADRCRQAYLTTGLCELPAFIRPTALQSLVEEANAVTHKAYFCDSTHNAYLTAGDDALPAESVENRQEKTFVGSVAYDYLPDQGYLKRLYLWDPLKDFIGYVLGKDAFHRLADPLGACSINVFVDGGQHGWHFDESEYTVTLMLQPPRQGGSFEYVPLIRGLADEKRVVADILDGNRSDVVELPFLPGTLLIFGGRQTIHRVTGVRGQQPRLVPVLCYSEQPDTRNSDSVRQLFWGRTGADGDSESAAQN